jgi:hypothetical protein
LIETRAGAQRMRRQGEGSVQGSEAHRAPHAGFGDQNSELLGDLTLLTN